jgi:uncharacterized membrane protein
VLAREWLRERFWALPAVLLVASVLLALATTWADSAGPAAGGGGRLLSVGAEDTLLAIIAASMPTFVGVVLTITLVGLQLASAQLSPRVLRTFVRSARRHGCVLELIPAIGSYVDTGTPVFAVHGGTAPPATQVVGCLDLRRARTLYQDPSFGLRQLVDVATQALSPAPNQAHLREGFERRRSTLVTLVEASAVGTVPALSRSPHRLGMG